jgi:group I intron endonuclease
MDSGVNVSCETDILEIRDKVFGSIYEITNIITGMRYVGQAVSHRKNKGKYRPFGILGRFKDHISEANNNTKKKQCSYLNNAIRKHGQDAFKVELLENCELSALDNREQHFITERNTMFPNGYNLTKGGKTAYVSTLLERTPLEEPKKRGGCTSRSAETREKMSNWQKAAIDDEYRLGRSASAKDQHYRGKLERFKNCIVDVAKTESYIRKKGTKIIVIINAIRADFASKHETIEQLKERARAFITDLMQRYQTAGSP